MTIADCSTPGAIVWLKLFNEGSFKDVNEMLDCTIPLRRSDPTTDPTAESYHTWHGFTRKCSSHFAS